MDYPSPENNVEFSFRVRTPYKNVKVVLKDGERVIRELKKPALLPAEMEKVILPGKTLAEIREGLNISIEEAQ